MPPAVRMRLLERYAGDAPAVIAAAGEEELSQVCSTPTLWAELRWAARAEGVVHLDDLLLRRTRLGLQLPGGGLEQGQAIRRIAQDELGWSDPRWLEEFERYDDIISRCSVANID